MSQKPAPGPSRGGATAGNQLSRRQRRANYVPGNNSGFVARGGYNPRGGHNLRGGFGPYDAGFAPRGGNVPRGNSRGPGANRGFVPRGNPGQRGAGYGRGGTQQHHYAAKKLPSQHKHSVATWTVQEGEVVYSFISRMRWRDQGRPMRGAAPESIPEPFKGHTLQDRHPNEPKAVYTAEEMERLCPSCGTLVVHWETHKASELHQEKLKRPAGIPAQPTQMDVVAALRVLQATRPDIIAASLSSASPHALLAAAGQASKAGLSLRDAGPGPSGFDRLAGGDYEPSRNDYERPRDSYERSPDDYEARRDDYERSSYGYRPAYDNYQRSLDDFGHSDDDFGRSRDGFLPLDDLVDEDLDGVPADHLDDPYPLPMRRRSPDDDDRLHMTPAKFARGLQPDLRHPTSSSFSWN